MRILLFVVSIYNTIDDISDNELKKIIDKLSIIADTEDDQKIIISICDSTENKSLVMNYIRKILKYIEDRRICFGNQFLGNVYYKDIINSGALLYDENFCKEQIILNYTNALEQEDNFINLYYVDGNMKDNINDYICKLNNNVSITLVRRNNEHIIPALDRVIKRKSLVYKEEKEPQLKN